MANVKISELPVASSVGATDSFPLVQGGTTKQATKAVLLDDLGTPSSVTLTNATGLPLTTGVTGTLPTGNGGTGLTSFTANGVVYASSGSALATGSALTFDGSNMTQSGPNAAVTLQVNTANVGVSASNYSEIALSDVGAVRTYWRSLRDGSGATIFSGNDHIRYALLGTEQMRLTSTGLGIGTSSPGARLGVQGNAIFSGGVGGSPFIAFSQDQIGGTPSYWQWSSTTGLTTFYTTDALAANGSFSWMTAGAERMRLDASGNLGLGVTPSAWVNYKPLQAGSGASFGGYAGDVLSFMGSNTYNDNTNWKYILGGNAAARYQQSGGVHAWYTAPSGTAGNAISFTQALTLDANRNLLLNGTAAPASGVGSFAIFNGTAPTGSVTDGCVLYTEDVSSSSELKVRDEAGNVTTLSPHNFELIPEGPSEDMAWSYYSERDGKRINVDMLKAIRLLEKLSGEKLVFEA